MFASVPNFTEFYSEDVNKGMECIRLLNEIIGTLLIFINQIKETAKVNIEIYSSVFLLIHTNIKHYFWVELIFCLKLLYILMQV